LDAKQDIHFVADSVPKSFRPLGLPLDRPARVEATDEQMYSCEKKSRFLLTHPLSEIQIFGYTDIRRNYGGGQSREKRKNYSSCQIAETIWHRGWRSRHY